MKSSFVQIAKIVSHSLGSKLCMTGEVPSAEDRADARVPEFQSNCSIPEGKMVRHFTSSPAFLHEVKY